MNAVPRLALLTQQKLKHRNIVRLCGLVDSDEEDMYVVMEYLPMGSLKDYLKTHREHINNTMLLKFAMDIAEVRWHMLTHHYLHHHGSHYHLVLSLMSPLALQIY